MTRHVAVSFLAALWVLGCSGRRLPPGTPGPEYEPPIVTPWQSEPPDAALPVSNAAGASAAPESAAGAQLSPDAGVR